MKRQSILFILLLLLTLTTLCGCSSAKNTTESAKETAPMEASMEEAVEETVEEASEDSADESAVSAASVTADTDTDTFERKIGDTTFENVTGVFEGLEDNHTALFSFDRVEVVFFFEDPEVQTVLSEAVVGSTYTLSYQYDAEQGLNIIYEISE